MANKHNAAPTPWVEVDSSPSALQNHIEALYWEGVTGEIGNVIISLKRLDDAPSILEEDDILKRLPAEASFFVEPWAPWKLDSKEWDNLWEHAATLMAEHQNYDLKYRRARMLLIGLGLLDINRVIDYREPPLRSFVGKVQVNIFEAKDSSGSPQLMIHAVPCCECGMAIRSRFYNCKENCIHHDATGKSKCSFAKHQYNVCTQCYSSSDHTKQHLQPIRPYDPVASMSLDEGRRSKLVRDIRKLQEKIDKEEDFQGGNKTLRTIFHAAPEWARKVALPYGNVHTRVMFGPQTYEIGARKSQGGALIMLRSPPDLSYSEQWRFIDSQKTSPAVAVSRDRKIFISTRDLEPQCVHATTVQVLGGLFSGHNPEWTEHENEVIRQLVTESLQYEEKPTKSRTYNANRLQEASKRIVSLLKSFLKKEVIAYLRHFVTMLLSSATNLKWDRMLNNCQKFCQDLVVNTDTFRTIFPKARMVDIEECSIPKYLLSFASKSFGSLYDNSIYHTTPTATYLAEFHTSEDIVEYFLTWSDIPKPNKCAELLCWPCQTDEDCSIGQHMWIFPHETTSLAHMHILRPRENYCHVYGTDDPLEDEPSPFTDGEWFCNRLLILLGLDSFLGSAGALSASYQTFPNKRCGQQDWHPPFVQDVGALIRQGSPGGNILNFTIENVNGKSRFSRLFPKNRSMAETIKQNLVSQHRSGEY